MTTNTPTPATLPNGWHMTTFGAVRKIGRGEVSVSYSTCYAAPGIATFLPWDDAAWSGRGGYGDKQLVVWREAPPKLLPVMLTEADIRATLDRPLIQQDGPEWDEAVKVSERILEAMQAALDGEA